MPRYPRTVNASCFMIVFISVITLPDARPIVAEATMNKPNTAKISVQRWMIKSYRYGIRKEVFFFCVKFIRLLVTFYHKSQPCTKELKFCF